MMKKNAELVMISFGLLLFLVSPVLGNYTIVWSTRHDGHLKMWWTTNGIRDPDPFVDIDIVIAPNTYEMREIAPRKDINDYHIQWLISSTNKKSNTNAIAGLGYPYSTFEDYFNSTSYDSITSYSLADGTGLSDVDVTIDLVAWGNYLESNPLPDPEGVFLFDANGLCPDLPGYEAVNLTAGAPFTGDMVVVGTSTLSAHEPLPGDANGDGVVSAADYSSVQANFGATGQSGIPGDANGDGVVSAADYSSVQANFGNTNPAIVTPEPVTLSLLSTGFLLMIRSDRRKK